MNSKTKAFNLVIFIVLSVALHIAAGVALYFLTPEAGVGVEGPYVVSLVPPEPAPVPQVQQKKAPPPKAKRRASVKRKSPPEPALPPEELSSRPSAPEAPKQPLSEAGVKPEAKDSASAARSVKKQEAESVAPGASPPSPEGKEPEDKLFDRDVLAGAIAKGKRTEPPESSVTFDTKEIRQWGYMQRLKERIEYVWKYPQEAAARGIYGDLVIRFVIKEDGSLGAVELVRTSGWKDLDSAAMQALRDGAPYWPLPEEWETNTLTVTGHFIYTIHGSYYVR